MRVRRTVLAVLCCTAFLRAQIGTLEASLKLLTIDTMAVPFQNGMAVPSFEKQPRTMVDLAGTWKKMRFSADHNVTMTKRDSAGYAQIAAEAAGRFSPWFDDAAWTDKSLPGVENTLNANEKVPEFYENGVWYRRHFTLSDSLAHRTATLVFYAVNYVADVWLNGHYLGWHEGGYTPFALDVSPFLRTDSANVLAVRVDNIPWGTRQDIVPFYTCDWFNYTGIIHDVYLSFTDTISVVRADVVPQNIDGLLNASVTVRNAGPSTNGVNVSLEVFEAKTDSAFLADDLSAHLAGTPVVVTGTAQTTVAVPADSIALWRTQISIPQPKLWSPNHPHLYIMKVTVSQQGVVKDEFFTQFGVRTIATAGDRILLNGKEIFLHGVARHEDHPSYGRSLPESQIYSDMLMVKGVNANYLRTGHYPNHPYTYQVMDRLGILGMEEIPVWWFDASSSWAIQNAARKIHLQMFREMVFRDYNRPSIGLWSTSNECKDVAGRSTFLQTVQAELDGKYPDGRLITQSAAADRPGAYDGSQKYTDVAGWTMYFGIFYNPYGGAGPYHGTKYFLVDAHDYYPDKPVIATEYGYWSGETRAHLAEQVQTFDSSYLAFKKYFPVTEDGAYNYNGFLAGITWWCIFDWYTHQSTGGFQSMGLYTMDRQMAKDVRNKLRTVYGLYNDIGENITGIPEEGNEAIPQEFSLEQNYPNPFNPSTTFAFSIPVSSPVTVTVYDVLGKHVATVVDETLPAGSYTRQWNASHLSSGVYFYRLRAGNYSGIRKMILMK